MNSKRAADRRKVIAELKGEEYAQFYYYGNLAAQITYGTIFLDLAFLLPAFAKDMTMFVIALLIGLALVFYLDLDIDSKLKKKKEDMMQEFPHVLSKMALLVNAGLPIRDTFYKIAENKSGNIYDEIHVMLNEMANGIPERKALSNLSERCGISEIRKFTSMLAQNLQKGSADTAQGLIEMSNDIWRNRTSHVRELGEKASTKLLIPIVIIFAGVLVMVLVPMASSISF
jgi:tight adherence protein C